jgi:hypothetical protein
MIYAPFFKEGYTVMHEDPLKTTKSTKIRKKGYLIFLLDLRDLRGA